MQALLEVVDSGAKNMEIAIVRFGKENEVSADRPPTFKKPSLLLVPAKGLACVWRERFRGGEGGGGGGSVHVEFSNAHTCDERDRWPFERTHCTQPAFNF